MKRIMGGSTTNMVDHMNYYAIVSFDIANSAQLRAKAVEEHRNRIADLQTEGRLLTAGPLPHTDTYGRETAEGVQGSIIIATFDNLEQARQWAAADPYRTNGVYYKSNVYPFKKVF